LVVLILSPLTTAALPSLAAAHVIDDDIVLALDDDGRLHRLTAAGWQAGETPCPTAGPYSLAYFSFADPEQPDNVFVIDRFGRLYQTDGTTWDELAPPPAEAVAPCPGSVYYADSAGIGVFLVDAAGRLFVDSTAGTWRTVEARLPAPPPLDSGSVYDAATASLEPFVLAADNRIYGLIDGEWQSTELETAAAGIRRFDHYHHRTTGFLLLLGLDESGRLYDNSSGELTPVDFPACPGTGPWEIELVRIEELDAFNVICLDSVGRLYLVDGDDWIPLAGPFSETAED
jgi:hypothetical protein